MNDTIVYSVREGVGYIAVSNPPVNALDLAVRRGLIAALARAVGDDDVQEIVLIGQGKTFPAGADIAEFDAPLQEPLLPELCDRIEDCAKPVIAAIHGTALGGGFEIALAAHYRIAHSSARIGLPEVRLGLLPGAGGTQRAPRLAGARIALDLMLGGRAYPVNVAPGQVFLDAMTDGDLAQAAQSFCLSLRAAGKGVRRARDSRRGFADPAAYQAEITARRKVVEGLAEQAPKEIVTAVEAALLLPFEAGMALEWDLFSDCLVSDQSAALRHAFFAERRAAKFPLPAELARPEIHTLAVLGGGPLAVNLVLTALSAGLSVQWGTRDPQILQAGVSQLAALFEQGVTNGRFTRMQADAHLARLRAGESAAMAKGADMIVHAARGQGNVPADPAIVRAVAMPGRVEELGLRFGGPVFATRLCEVVAGPLATPAQMAAGLALVRRLGKVAVRVVSDGETIVGRMAAALHRAADALVDMGQSPVDIDTALRGWGWSRVPFETRDTLGLDDFVQAPRAPGARNWSAVLTGAGRSGRVSGAGFYRYSDGADTPLPDPDLDRLLDAQRAALRPMAPERIALLLLGALANEGARMLGDGCVARPSDLDIAMILGQGFPRWRGGPMKAADQVGLLRLSKALEQVDHVDSAFWHPEPQFLELIKNGRQFDSLNRRT